MPSSFTSCLRSRSMPWSLTTVSKRCSRGSPPFLPRSAWRPCHKLNSAHGWPSRRTFLGLVGSGADQLPSACALQPSISVRPADRHLLALHGADRHAVALGRSTSRYTPPRSTIVSPGLATRTALARLASGTAG